MKIMMRLLTRFGDFAAKPRLLHGASVFRLLAGTAVSMQYLLNYAQRHYLFGPDGLYPWDEFARSSQGFSLYRLSANPVWFELLYHLGVVVAIAWAAGWRTRILTPVNFVLWSSLHARNSLLWDGGDNVMQIVFVYAFFADLSAYWSLEAVRDKGRDLTSGSLRWVFHNAAMLAMALQIALVYFSAGVAKMHGHTWPSGTALYYVLRASAYSLPPFSDWMARQAGLQVLLCYATMAFQVSFPCMLFLNKYSRRVAIVIGLAFHIAILVGMGLTTFAMFMMAVDLALVSDDEYRAIFGIIRSLRRTAVIERPARAPLAASW